MENFLLKKKAMLMGANEFWLPAGVGRDHVLAAYRFKGVSSADFALQDLTLRNYDLSVSQTNPPTWNSASGFTFSAISGSTQTSNYLDNPALDQCDIKSAVVCFSGVTQNNRVILISAGGASGKAQIFAATSAQVITAINDETQEVQSEYRNYGGPGFASTPYTNWKNVGRMKYSGSTQKASGVIGVTWNDTTPKMYLDGVESVLSTTTVDYPHTYTDIGDGGHLGKTFGNSHSSKAGLNAGTFGAKVIIAASFYDIELTADDHAEIAAAMLAL